MMTFNRSAIVLVLLTSSVLSFSQAIPLEVFVGDMYLQTNIVVSKPMFEESKFGLLNVSSFDAYYDDARFNGSVMVTEVNYEVVKGTGVGVGMTYNSVSGLAPTIGLGYNNFGRRHGVTLAPAVSISDRSTVRVIANVSVRPKLSETLNLYFSSNNLFTYDFDGEHVRSFQKVRAGLDLKSFQFGFGVNFDQFGTASVSQTNIGGFLRKEFN